MQILTFHTISINYHQYLLRLGAVTLLTEFSVLIKGTNNPENYFKKNILSRKYYYYQTPMGDLSETHQRPFGDPLETDMPDQRPI